MSEEGGVAAVERAPTLSLCETALREVSTAIERMLNRIAVEHPRATLLDVGCWDGTSSARWGTALGALRILGVEVFREPAVAAEGRGLEVAKVDVENDPLPWPDASVDVIVCNQVLEHLKNIWLPMTEMHRVLRPGGHAILSVPNLASLHNRVLLGVGRQPSSIRTFGPHVRSFTFVEFVAFVERDGAYLVEQRQTAGFHPLPARLSRLATAVWRSAGHTTVLLARKRAIRPPWLDYISGQVEGGMQTFYAE